MPDTEPLLRSEPTGREVCATLLVRGSLHAHACALALNKITGVETAKMLPTPNSDPDRVPECQKSLDESKHRRLYTFSPEDEVAKETVGDVALALAKIGCGPRASPRLKLGGMSHPPQSPRR